MVVGTAFFNGAFLCFRFAAWESTGASSVCSDSELDEESDEESLFRFNRGVDGVDRELTDDILTLTRTDADTSNQPYSVRVGPWKSNLTIITVQRIQNLYRSVEAGVSGGTFSDSASLASASSSSRHEWSMVGCFAASSR